MTRLYRLIHGLDILLIVSIIRLWINEIVEGDWHLGVERLIMLIFRDIKGTFSRIIIFLNVFGSLDLLSNPLKF